MSPACVSLLTDFGLHDTYVGVMHGVLARLAPEARVIDLSHDVPPQDVRTAAFFWEQALPYFPPGVVHLAVVDPGVGTARAILLARRPEGVLIAPDNGLLAPFAADAELFRFEAWERALPDRATTFDGRDVFSPIAACVAQGVPLEALGSPIAREAIAPLARAAPRDLGGGTWEGEVIHVDRFGNLITNLPSSLPVASLTVGGATIEGPAAAGYGEREPGATMVIAGSSRRLEVSVNRGSAARALAVHRGATVLLCVNPRQSHP
ncbi:MAG: SAM-dependent chlorinase/fluorinase [Planctomycetes bacterium]|nr:SAM-dependent chlorinase/fluorinase [Planctomycetota bacterium]